MSSPEEVGVVALIQRQLADAPFSCSSLTRMTAGTTNFVFRGTLTRPLDSPGGLSKSVIIKHCKDHVPENEDFPLDLSRCLVEELMLAALDSFPTTCLGVTTPRLYFFDQNASLMVMADLPHAVDLKSILVSPQVNTTLTTPVASSVGYGLGVWLRAFHTWGSRPAQIQLLKSLGQNAPMRRLKFRITYDTFIPVLRNFAPILGDDEPILEAVRQMAVEEFEMMPIGTVTAEEGWGLIHGDFWTGNVLLSLDSSELFVVDWEFAQFGNWAYDLGQMIGDIYERAHFHSVDNAMLMMREFVLGYGGLNDELAFRVAIHSGVQLLGWYTRRAPRQPVFGTPSQIEQAARLGREFVLRGWRRDRLWFEQSVLAPLFI